MRRDRSLIFIFFLLLIFLFGIVFVFLYLADKQIHGLILDAASGKPIAAATLQVGAAQTRSNQAGQFRADLAQKQNIFLAASAPGYLPIKFTFDMPWYLRTGYVDINLTPFGFSLQIVDSWTDAPLQNLPVQIGDAFQVTDQAGMVYLTAQHLQLPLLITINQPGYLPKQMRLTRLPNGSAELPLRISLEPHVLTGFVIAGNTGQPLAGVRVTVDDQTWQTDKEGRLFLFRLQPGDLLSILPNDEFLPADLLFEGQSSVTVELLPRQLNVKVIDALSRAPVADAQVQTQNQAVLTDPQGEAHLPHIPAQGTLLARHPAYHAQAVTYHLDQPKTIALKPKAVQGIVRDAYTGQPLAYTYGSLNGVPFALDSDGRYQLLNLDQTMTLRFKQAGYKPAQLTIGAEDITPHNLELYPCQPAGSSDESPQSVCLDLLMQPFSAKAVYIPFNLLSKPDSVEAIFDLVDRTELNAIILDVKGDSGFLAWDSQVLQADLLGVDGNREGWLTLETFLAEAQARNIYTIARLVIFKDNPLAFANPDLAVMYADGSIWLDGEGLAWVNPFRQEVWDYNIALATEIAALGFDEINLDYLRFPSDGDIAAIALPQENTLETRTTAIRTFTSLMSQALAPYGTYLSADVFGLTVWVEPENDMNIGQRVIDIAPYVDYLSPMIYPATFVPGNLGLVDPPAYPYEVVFRSQQAAMERVPVTTRVRPWLQAYWYSSYEMLLQKQAANDAGSTGWLWWNAAGVYDETIFAAD